MGAFGNNEVGVALRRLGELQVHGPDRLEVMLGDRFQRTTSIFDVTRKPSEDAHVGIGVDEELHVEARAERLLRQHHDALEKDDGRGLDELSGIYARVRDVVVSEPGNGPTRLECIEMLE